MGQDKHHLQLRLDPELKQELSRLARKYDMSLSDIVRGTLFFGLPVFDALSGLRNELVARLIKNLKKEARANG